MEYSESTCNSIGVAGIYGQRWSLTAYRLTLVLNHHRWKNITVENWFQSDNVRGKNFREKRIVDDRRDACLFDMKIKYSIPINNVN